MCMRGPWSQQSNVQRVIFPGLNNNSKDVVVNITKDCDNAIARDLRLSISG